MSEFKQYIPLDEICRERIAQGQSLIDSVMCDEEFIYGCQQTIGIDLASCYQTFNELGNPEKDKISYTVANEARFIAKMCFISGVSEVEMKQDFIPQGVLNCFSYIMTVGIDNYLTLSNTRFQKLMKN